jgi:hypothetical protein
VIVTYVRAATEVASKARDQIADSAVDVFGVRDEAVALGSVE